MLLPPRKLALAALLLPICAQADHMEELVVSAAHDTRSIDISEEIIASSDVTQLLTKAPGANVNSNGPITGIPQYRGLFGARIAASLDGMQLAPSGPNWMDPPLSYAIGGQLESLELYRGIVPVSVAQEAIGGAVDARSRRGDFASGSDLDLHGRVIASAQSVNSGYHLSAALYGASRNQRLKISAMTESADDAEFPGGEIRPTEYERQRYDVGYGFRVGAHTLQLDYGYNDTGDSGTPALPMDIELIEGDLYRLGYRFDNGGRATLDAKLYASELDHSMSNFALREAPPAPLWRRNTAASDNVGFDLAATFSGETGAWKVGLDGFRQRHDSDIDNPNSPMFFVNNFNDASRDVLGVFLERSHTISDDWRAEIGLRYNRVEMDAGEVDGTPAMMMPPAMALRDAFNAADREQTDNNVDAVARTWLAISARNSLYLGIARRTRSPSYQERYLWLPLEATAGLADGNLYTGNIELEPEVSRQLEFGLDFSGERLTLSPRIFYNNVKDYIQGTPSDEPAAVMMVRMMNTMNGSNNPDPLRFTNVDAELYGFDMDWYLQLDHHWALAGIVNYVRGQRNDGSNDDLYRIAPPNMSARVIYTANRWSAEVEGITYAEQDNVSADNRELESSGYGIVNLLTTWRASEELQLALGVDNVFDREYQPHLGGYNRAANTDIARGERLPASGLNVFARLMYNF
ncbi:MAG: TonB-dependent receptor [Halioglobus sp.]|nr:TonB-dependent receptor [Halioglobus sp.]